MPYQHPAVCLRHETGVHVPDWNTVTRDVQAPTGVLDVNCVNCGLSGSFVVSDDDVAWA